MNLKKTLLTVALCALFVLQSLAAPAYPHPITVTQPDGQTLTIQLHGDEFFSYVTTTDGYLLKQNNAGAYEYAYLNNDNTVEAIGVVAHNNRTATEITALESVKDKQKPCDSCCSQKTPHTRRSQQRHEQTVAKPIERFCKGLGYLGELQRPRFHHLQPTTSFHTNVEPTRLLTQRRYRLCF